MPRRAIIKLENVNKSFKVGKGKVDVLFDIDLEIFPGEFVVIFGPSGCGKSTLLNTIVGLEVPTSGKVILRGEDVYKLDSGARSGLRRKKFGIVHQQPNWLKSLNVLENIALPLCISGKKEREAKKRGKLLMELFRLEEFEKSCPTELSGGQQQRASVVRALVSNPHILVADEPTGNLDTNSASDLMYVFKFLNEESKRTIIMVTHNPDYERYATKIVKMEDGKIKSVEEKKKVMVGEDEIAEDILMGTEAQDVHA